MSALIDKNISLEILNSLGIYELRELARSIGVSSPTTKKREELCNEILKISSGEQKVLHNISKRGRPPKTITKISKIVKDFIPEEILKLQKPIENESYANILMLAQNPSILKRINSDDIKKIYGYVNSISGHYYINNLKINELFKTSTFYIPNELVDKFFLREGDKIIALARNSDDYNCGIVDEIIFINDVESKLWNSKRKFININTCEIPKIETKIFNTVIKRGERTLSFFKDDEEAILKIIDEIEKLSKDENKNEIFVFLGVEIAPEVIFYGKTKNNLEMFSTSYTNNLEDSYNSIINAINYCKTQLKDGNSIRFFIFDVVGIITRLDQYFANHDATYLGHNVMGVQLVKKLVGMGKAISQDLTLTSHAIAFDKQKDDELIKNELIKITKII